MGVRTAKETIACCKPYETGVAVEKLAKLKSAVYEGVGGSACSLGCCGRFASGAIWKKVARKYFHSKMFAPMSAAFLHDENVCGHLTPGDLPLGKMRKAGRNLEPCKLELWLLAGVHVPRWAGLLESAAAMGLRVCRNPGKQSG